MTTTANGSAASMWVDLKEGLRFVLGNPNLRAQAGCTATSNFFSSLAFGIFIVFAIRELGPLPGRDRRHLLDRRGGLARRSLHGNTHLGSLRHRADVDRRRRALRPDDAAHGACSGRERSNPGARRRRLVFGFTVVVYNIVQVSYRQAICPPRLQGRMNSVMRFMVWGTIPLGTLAGGALATWIGLRETIVIGAIGGGLSFLWLLLSPQRHLREMPEPVDDTVAEAAAA